MIIFPAVDIQNGKAVRLKQGRAHESTVFSPDPVAAAVAWRDKGARWLHVVDLDGAFDGLPKSRDIVRDICRELDIPVCDAYQYWKELAASGVDTTARLANHINHPDAGMHTVFAQLLAAMI